MSHDDASNSPFAKLQESREEWRTRYGRDVGFLRAKVSVVRDELLKLFSDGATYLRDVLVTLESTPESTDDEPIPEHLVGDVHVCGDCGCREGELHEPGCYKAECPNCGGQLVSCACSQRVLMTMDRIRFVYYPVVCARCGRLNPPLFRVPDVEWKTYVSPSKRGEVLCRECYDWIKKLQDEAP